MVVWETSRDKVFSGRISGEGLAGGPPATLCMFGPQCTEGNAQLSPSSLSVIEGRAGSTKGSLGDCPSQLALLGPDIMPAVFPPSTVVW